MKRTLIYIAILTAAAAVYGNAGTVISHIGKTYGNFESTLLSTTSEPMSLFLIGGGLTGLGLIGRRRPDGDL